MAFDSAKPNTGQTIGDVIVAANANDVALKAQQDAHEADASTAHGLAALLATQTAYNVHAADTTTAHGIGATNADVAALLAEIAAGRGSQASLAARLAVALQSDGAIKLSSLASKWLDNGDTPTFIDATHFTVPNDRTKVYLAGVLLRCTISGSYAYAQVASSSFGSGVTTVTIDPAYPILTSGLGKAEIALIAFDNAIANAVTAANAAITAVQGQVTAIRQASSKAGDPTTSDLTAGNVGVWKNTSSGALKLWANDGGTLKSVTLS